MGCLGCILNFIENGLLNNCHKIGKLIIIIPNQTNKQIRTRCIHDSLLKPTHQIMTIFVLVVNNVILENFFTLHHYHYQRTQFVPGTGPGSSNSILVTYVAVWPSLNYFRKNYSGYCGLLLRHTSE